MLLKIKEKDIVFSVAKLFFAYGLGNAMTFPMGIGATTALFPLRPTPDSVNDIMNKIKPTILFAVPTIYAAMLVNLRKENNTNFDNLRICVSAGEALPSQIGQDWKSITGVDILDGVGSTEMLHIFLSNKPDDIVYGTSGSAVPGYKLRLVNEKNEEGNNKFPVIRRDSRIFGNKFNLRNQSDRTFPSRSTGTRGLNNVPTRGSSTITSITRNRPGAMAPGGVGVDVKHGSYARYLAKIKASNIVGPKNTKHGPFDKSDNVNNSINRLAKQIDGLEARLRPAVNNKQFRFCLLYTSPSPRDRQKSRMPSSA